VPGLGCNAPSFWGNNQPYGVNDLYALALNDGFRTAFVSFAADGEKPFDMWQNGRMFAWQLGEICRYFKTDSVIVAGHSKGGVDAQTAAAFFGAAPRIKRLITLSAPHFGSQLADLAYSTFGWELAEHLGQHSEGCYCMQTSYMQSYRKAADLNPPNNTAIETFAGNGGAPIFAEFWAGHEFLSLYGENDGVVTVNSAHNPNGRHIGTLPLNHMQMMVGQNIWAYLKPAIMGALAIEQPAAVKTAAPVGLIFRGGRLENGVADEFPADSTVKSLEVYMALSVKTGSQTDTDLQLFAPSGAVYRDFQAVNGPFGTKLLRIKVDAPQTGNWHIIVPAMTGAYLTQIRLHGSFRAYPAEAAGNAVMQQLGNGNVSTVFKVIKTFADHIEMTAEHIIDPGGYRPPLHLGDGAFTLESVVKGVLADGSPFERNILRPVLTGAIEALKGAVETGIISDII